MNFMCTLLKEQRTLEGKFATGILVVSVSVPTMVRPVGLLSYLQCVKDEWNRV